MRGLATDVLHRERAGQVEERKQEGPDGHGDVIVAVVTALLAEVTTRDVTHPGFGLADSANDDAQNLLDEERDDGDECRDGNHADACERDEQDEHPTDDEREHQHFDCAQSQVHAIGATRKNFAVVLHDENTPQVLVPIRTAGRRLTSVFSEHERLPCS